MAKVRVPLEGLAAHIAGKVPAFKARLQSGMTRFLVDSGTMVDMEMKRGYYRSGLRRRTGALYGGTYHSIISEPMRWTMRIQNEEKHAIFMEKGTKPHIIEGKPILSWVDDGGVRRFARRVHHPGTRPYKFILEPAKWVAKVLRGRVKAVIQRIWEAA